jgi:tetratricopeptide (TPR) repeat protein
MGKYNDAITFFTKNIEFDSDNVSIYQNRAVCFHKIQNFDMAINDLDFVIKKKPTALAYFNRGNMFYGLGDYELGEKDHNVAVLMDPSLKKKIKSIR